MARTPSRVSERRLIQVGSIWTDGSTDVEVCSVQCYDDYRYIVYRTLGEKKGKKSQPLDDHTFSLRYTAKVVRTEEVKPLASILAKNEDADAGKVKMVGWAG